MPIQLARCAALVVAVLLSGTVSAAPITFNFVYSTVVAPSQATSRHATAYAQNTREAITTPQASGTGQIAGSITFESTLLANPGDNELTVPGSAVLALDVTVSGASSGNGHFTLADFEGVAFSTGGGTLNLAQQLVGQAIPGGTWGDPGLETGDFNLFGASGSPTAPNGEFYFTLCTNGGSGDCFELTSMQPAAQAGGAAAAPALNAWMLALLAAMLAAVAWRRQIQRRRSMPS